MALVGNGLKSKQISKIGSKDKVIKAIIRIALLLVLLFVVWAQNNMLTVGHITYKVNDLPKSLTGFKIVHLSDMSNSHIDVVSDVAKLSPDVIILSGGYCDGTGDYYNTKLQVQQLANIAPTYYIYNYEDEQLTNYDDFLADTGAVNITDSYVNIPPRELSASDFIRYNYGDGIANKINSAVNKQSSGSELTEEEIKLVNYYVYVRQALEDTSATSFRLIGLDAEYENDGKDAFSIVTDILKEGAVGYDAAVLGDPTMANEVSTTQIDAIFSGGTYGTNYLSDKYKKGTYGLTSTQLFISGGIGLHDEITRVAGIKTRFFNFPEIQCITLSDGTLFNKNPLEKVLDSIIPNMGTIYDNDGGFEM